jgi:hypothetical protein
MLYKPGPLRSSVVRRNDGESRDLRSICDNLERELERRDQRNDNLSRELLSLRATLANQQVNNNHYWFHHNRSQITGFIFLSSVNIE